MKFAIFAAGYYWLVKLLYKFCALYVGWSYPWFMGGWYDKTHHLVRSIPSYGYSFDNIVRDNFADGDLVFWQIWFGVGLLLWILRMIFRSPRQA